MLFLTKTQVNETLLIHDFYIIFIKDNLFPDTKRMTLLILDLNCPKLFTLPYRELYFCIFYITCTYSFNNH